MGIRWTFIDKQQQQQQQQEKQKQKHHRHRHCHQQKCQQQMPKQTKPIQREHLNIQLRHQGYHSQPQQQHHQQQHLHQHQQPPIFIPSTQSKSNSQIDAHTSCGEIDNKTSPTISTTTSTATTTKITDTQKPLPPIQSRSKSPSCSQYSCPEWQWGAPIQKPIDTKSPERFRCLWKFGLTLALIIGSLSLAPVEERLNGMKAPTTATPTAAATTMAAFLLLKATTASSTCSPTTTSATTASVIAAYSLLPVASAASLNLRQVTSTYETPPHRPAVGPPGEQPSSSSLLKFRIDDDTDDAMRAAETEVEAEALDETDDEAEGDVDVDVDVDEENDADLELTGYSNNAEQLYAYYQRAQQEHQHQQQQRRHRQRSAAPSMALPSVVEFDDIVVPSVSAVISTLNPADMRTKKIASKRSASKSLLSSLPAPEMLATASADDQTDTAPATTTPNIAASTTTISPSPSSSPSSGSSSSSSSSAAPSTVTTVGVTANTTTTTSMPSTTSPAEEEKCEPKVLDDIPAEPFYDFTDIAEDAARQFTEFLANKFPANSLPPPQPPPPPLTDQLREEVRRRANSIASYALNEDDNLLAFAIAAPSIHTVVVKFRDNVTIPPEQVHNRAFLGSYWRELGYAWNSTDGSQEWGAPFRDCNLLKGRWLWPFRISFSEYKIRIVAAAFIAADEDVCNDGLEDIFGRRHGCDRNTTFCLLTENKPAATRDVYTCICREGFYLPNSTLQGFRGDIVEFSEGFDNYSCVPCPGGCSTCDQYGVCLLGEPQEVVSMESLLKVSMGSVLGACILCCLVLSFIIFQQRKSKAVASAMWTILETILLGILLLYASVAVHFFPASTLRCLLEPWLRELGFITCYGAIILKLYRHLVDFRTRKAHRWVLRDVDLLKYLGTMVFAVVCYMGAFTASSLDLLESAQLESLREIRTNTCLPLKWEYVTQTSEVLILCFGLHLCFASRNANTQFRERQCLVAALVIEFLVSGSFYVLRSVYLPEMSPGAIFLALFFRSQLTNTIALGLIFVPKLWYQHKQVRSLAHDLSIRLPVDAFKGSSHDAGQRLGVGYAGLCLGDPDIGELTISEMSPEDIRAELKRLYTQLEILKNKSLRQDNPHISKRRGGRKAGHRRFSLQKKGSKDKALSAKHRNKHHQDIEVTEAEPSRTPEDSVCSVEGPTDTYAEISGISHSMLSHSVVSHSVVSHSK